MRPCLTGRPRAHRTEAELNRGHGPGSPSTPGISTLPIPGPACSLWVWSDSCWSSRARIRKPHARARYDSAIRPCHPSGARSIALASGPRRVHRERRPLPSGRFAAPRGHTAPRRLDAGGADPSRIFLPPTGTDVGVPLLFAAAALLGVAARILRPGAALLLTRAGRHSTRNIDRLIRRRESSRHRALLRWQVGIARGALPGGGVFGTLLIDDARRDTGVDLDHLALATVHWALKDGNDLKPGGFWRMCSISPSARRDSSPRPFRLGHPFG